MPTLEDIRLGQLSVAKGLCQPLEVEECLALQHKNETSGNAEPLGELMISRGYLTRTQLTRLLTLQREAEQKVTRIGDYELLRKLGEGGMGAVYEAKDTRNGTIVALKVLPRSRARDKTFLQRFEQEVRAAFELDHPNIVHGLDQNFADGYHFLVMEFVQGNDVYSLLEKKGRLGEAETLGILEQIASALDHIHGERLVHRDIKPENILITDDGVAKLADMGLAVDNETQGRRRITQAGIAMGTPFYLSPEQIEGKSEVDIRSDIYALGATIYEMVTGRPPFEGETPAVVMMKHLNEQVPSPHDIDRKISLEFCHLLEKMMAKDPAQRYQAPAELLTDVQRVKAGESPLGTRPPIGKSSVSRPEQHQDHPLERKNGDKRSEKAVIVPERATENAEKLEALIGASAGGAHDSRADSRHDSRGDSRAGTAVRKRSMKDMPALAAKGNRSNAQAVPETDQSMRYVFFIGIAVAVAVIAFILISSLGPK
jgi:serine/threonine protein kinase